MSRSVYPVARPVFPRLGRELEVVELEFPTVYAMYRFWITPYVSGERVDVYEHEVTLDGFYLYVYTMCISAEIRVYVDGELVDVITLSRYGSALKEYWRRGRVRVEVRSAGWHEYSYVEITEFIQVDGEWVFRLSTEDLRRRVESATRGLARATQVCVYVRFATSGMRYSVDGVESENYLEFYECYDGARELEVRILGRGIVETYIAMFAGIIEIAKPMLILYNETIHRICDAFTGTCNKKVPYYWKPAIYECSDPLRIVAIITDDKRLLELSEIYGSWSVQEEYEEIH